MNTYDLKDLDRLVSLTCQKKFDDLQNAFAKVVAELLDNKIFRLYLNKQLNEGAEPNFSLIATSANQVTDAIRKSDTKQLSIFTARSIEDTDYQSSTEHILLPILHVHQILGALVIDHDVDFYADAIANVLLSAITIFANQMSLLQNSSQDALTGLYNRYMLDNTMEHILAIGQSRREADCKEHHWCLAMIDIDHFKSVNDTYGHLIGDEVLLQLAQLMKKCFRHEDLLFRFGGEEFSILLKGVGLEQAIVILERFRLSVSDYRFPQVGQVTVSLGVTFMSPGKFPSALLGNADKALYYSKEHGRNQLNCFEHLYELKLLGDITSENNDLEFF